MCELCNQFPCLSGCPNEQPVTEYKICTSCGDVIDDEYAEMDDGPVCYNCLHDFSVSDWLEMLNLELLQVGDE